MDAKPTPAVAPEAPPLVAPILPATGFVRLAKIIGKPPTKADPNGIPAIVPVSRASWWAGVKNGRYPAPVKLAPNTTAWRVEDIRALIQRMGGAA